MQKFIFPNVTTQIEIGQNGKMVDVQKVQNENNAQLKEGAIRSFDNVLTLHRRHIPGENL